MKKTCLQCKKEYNNRNKKYCSLTCKQKVGMNNGYKWTESQKKQHSLNKIGKSPRIWKDSERIKLSKTKTGLKLSLNHKLNLIKIAKRGEMNPNWKGGVSIIDKKVRLMSEYKIWRTLIFQRDEWTCQTCHSKGYVTAHHIKSFSSILKEYKISNQEEARKCLELWNVNNGITLCEECHSLTDNYKGRNKNKK